MSKEKYLVTGAAGFIGANLTRTLVERGRIVYPLIQPETNTWRLHDLEINPDNYLTVDVTDFDALRREVSRVKPTHILHLATYGVHRDQADQIKIFNTNVLGTANLLRVGLDLDLAAFINTGSVFEYGNLSGEQTESCQGLPRSMYDLAKIISSQTASSFARNYNLPVCTLRLFTAFGPYEDKRRLVASVIASLLGGQTPDIKTPQAIRDFIYIQDVVEAYCLAGAKSDWQGEVMNIGSGQPTAVGSLVKEVASILGIEAPKLEVKQPVSFQDSRSWASISAARTLLRWSPKLNLSQGLTQTVDWFRQHQGLYEK